MRAEHEDLEALLPWYLNGSLDEAERGRVEAWLAESPQAREELEWLRALRQSLRQQPPVQGPGELGLRRLLRDVRRRPRRRPWSAVAAALVIVVQSAALLWLSWEQDGAYRPLSGADETELLQVRFRPDASEAEIREALLEAEAVIVDGPGATGLYRLRLRDGSGERRLRERGGLILELQRQ